MDPLRRGRWYIAASGVVLLLGAAVAQTTAHAQVPNRQPISQRGTLHCGVDATEAEYTTNDDHGPRVAFDTALCRAVAVALMGQRAKFTVQTFQDDGGAVAALRSGEVDLVPTLSADLTHSTDPTLALTTPVLHDAVTLLAPVSIAHAEELKGKKICFLAETETEVALLDWDRMRDVGYIPFPFQEEGEMEAAFVTGNCAAVAGDATRLGGIRASLGVHAGAYRVLPELLRDDPLAMAVGTRTPELLRIAQWTLEVLLLAEQGGIVRASATGFPERRRETADRLLGRTGEIGRPFGLRDNWAADVIATTGNYGELYEHTLGAASAMGIPRGVNALCGAGGAMCPMPVK